MKRFRAPHEDNARERAWQVVRAAFEQREPVAPTRRLARPALALAVGLVAAAAVTATLLSPAGEALRDAIGREKHVTRYRPALFSLPTLGRLLVNSPRGPWVVSADGSKRLLGPYHDASWSPQGLYLAAVRAHELVALDPKGNVRWTLARSGLIGSPRWSPEHSGSTRIAYLRDQTLRIVAGDGTGDHVLDRYVAQIPPAWKPGAGFVLAYSDGPSHRVRVVKVDSGRPLWSRRESEPFALAWSDDGSRLLVLRSYSFVVFSRSGQLIGRGRFPRHSYAVGAAFEPGTHRLAFLLRYRDRSAVALGNADNPVSPIHLIFSAAGTFNGAAWSPDGRWLAVGWPSADAWVLIGPSGAKRIVSDVTRQFGGVGTLAASAWCCADGTRTP